MIKKGANIYTFLKLGTTFNSLHIDIILFYELNSDIS
jgi:hypothetical protein